MPTLTKRIGIKEFRANITSLSREAQQKNISYIVFNHSKPILRVEPFVENDEILQYLAVPKTSKKRKLVLPSETTSLYSDQQIEQWIRSDRLDQKTARKIKRLLA